MRMKTLAVTVSIAAVALSATACKSGSNGAAASTKPSDTVAAATQAAATQAPATQAASTEAAAAASTSASTAPSSPSSSSASSAAAPAAADTGEINACSLLTGAQASSLTGTTYGTGTASTIAKGQDQCDYPYSGAGIDLTVIVYEPDSGVSWATANAVLSGVGTVAQVTGVGDKAIFAGIELDIQTGKWIVAIQGADKLGQDTNAIAIGKQLVTALSSK